MNIEIFMAKFRQEEKGTKRDKFYFCIQLDGLCLLCTSSKFCNCYTFWPIKTGVGCSGNRFDLPVPVNAYLGLDESYVEEVQDI